MKPQKLVKPYNILLVEDNPADIRLTLEVFKEGEIRNTLNVVMDGEEALTYLRKKGKFTEAKTPDLVLLDLNLPKKNGKVVLSEIKLDKDLKCIPVIVLTTSSEERDISSAYSNHANCFISKPMELSNFVEVLRAIEKFWLSIVKLPPVAGLN